MQDFADAAIASPTGAGMLAQLEAQERDDVAWNRWPAVSDPAAVTRAAEAVEQMSFEGVCLLALNVGHSWAGPFNSAERVGPALHDASARRPIAAAIDSRFATELHAPFDPDIQQWWWSGAMSATPQKFLDFHKVYACGEFPWSGLWTVSDPPFLLSEEMIDALGAAWDFAERPSVRFGLPAIGSPRVREVHRPADWRSLVLEYPTAAAEQHTGWEFARWENPKQQNRWNPVARRRPSHVGMPRHLNPDWAAVARDWDAIHLSWAGYITADGFVDIDVEDNTVTMLRYWGSERTLWLSDPGGDIVGAPAPVVGDGRGVDPGPVSTAEANDFTEHWRAELSHRLGRN